MFTATALAIELISKFTQGAWLVVIIIPLLMLLFSRIHAVYARIGAALRIGQLPPKPERRSSLVVVPVGSMSLLTEEGISAALSLGEEVIAVTVCYADRSDAEVDAHFREQWEEWHPDVPLVSLRTEHRSLAPPIVDYLRTLDATNDNDQMVVLIPEVQPARWWQAILHNQRGFVLQRAIQRGTTNIVICRLRFRLDAVAQAGQADPHPDAGQLSSGPG